MQSAKRAYVESCETFVKGFAKGRPVLVQYVRKNGDHGPKVGVVVAYRSFSNGTVYVGWSLCSKRDRFDRYVGLKMAIQRAKPLDEISYDDCAHTVFDDVVEMIDRATRYFKVDASNSFEFTPSQIKWV